MVEGARHQGRRSQQVQPQAAFHLRQEILQTTAPYRKCLQSAQGLPTNRHSIRQAGAKLSRLRLPRRCYRMVDLMSLDPRSILDSLLADQALSDMFDDNDAGPA